MDDFSVSLVEQPRTPLALVFTDSHGRVISMHGALLDKLSFNDPGQIIGEPLHTILGIDYDTAKHLVENVAQNGNVADWSLEILPQTDTPITVLCSSVATFNDRGSFIGADITLYEQAASSTTADSQPADHRDTLVTRIRQVQAGLESEEDQLLLQLYVAVQFSALQVLLARMAGLRVAKTLETTINKLADKRGWPISIKGDRVLLKQATIPPDTYRALLDETLRFAANITGRRTIVAEMRAVDERMNPRAVELAKEAGLRHLFQDTGLLRSNG